MKTAELLRIEAKTKNFFSTFQKFNLFAKYAMNLQSLVFLENQTDWKLQIFSLLQKMQNKRKKSFFWVKSERKSFSLKTHLKCFCSIQQNFCWNFKQKFVAVLKMIYLVFSSASYYTEGQSRELQLNAILIYSRICQIMKIYNLCCINLSH